MRKTYVNHPSLRRESKARSNRRKSEQVKNYGIDWADWEPIRDVGTYVNGRSTYVHNGESKFL
jgi:hypothetical protein